MQARIKEKLERLQARREEVSALLADPEIMADQNRFRELSREYTQIDPVVQSFNRYQAVVKRYQEATEMAQEPDADLRQLARQEATECEQEKESLQRELQILLLPRDPLDDANIFLEIRAGTGGDEAALFAGDLLRMYTRYAEQVHWQVEILSAHAGEHGGYKEVIARVVGQQAYSRLKFESGAHRVQRVPETESQGRVHTSACTVAVLPERDAIDEVEINAADLRIDTYRASGAGGQHVNKTDSAIRITHKPSGMVVECQDERSQHKNKARAMSLLKARLLDQQRSEQQREVAESRRLQVGSGDRSQRIRTYNFPQGRITDHRINLTLYKLGEIMAGNLEPLLTPLNQEYQTRQLADLAGG